MCVRYLCVDAQAQRRRPLAPPSECFASARLMDIFPYVYQNCSVDINYVYLREKRKISIYLSSSAESQISACATGYLCRTVERWRGIHWFSLFDVKIK